MDSIPAVSRSASYPWRATLFGWLLISICVGVRLRGPVSQPESAPSDLFSAERAVRRLARVLGDQSPHPAGSLENLQVRERLVQELRALHLDVSVQSSATGNGEYPQVHNVLARLPNSPALGRPLILATHYDSCLSGPGAGDAGSAIAALLEAAGILQHESGLTHPVYFLFTDAEEMGMVGAQRFVADQPLAQTRPFPFVVNFDARGNAGPALIYETHDGNLLLVRNLLARLPLRVFTGSPFVSVYRLMPNDTDFTVFRRAGWEGLNVAILEGAHHYHMPDDRLEFLDHRSVQHLGELAVAMVRTLAKGELEACGAGSHAVFFDVLGFVLVWYPERWAGPLAFLAVVSLGAARGRAWLRGATWFSLWSGQFLLLFMIAVAAAVGFGMGRLYIASELLAAPFVRYGGWIIGGYWLVALVVLGCFRETATRIGAEHVWFAVWSSWALLALCTAVGAPGFSHLFALPCLIAGGCRLLRVPPRWSACVAAISVGLLWLPILHLLGIALGPQPGFLLCPVFLFGLSAWLPLLPPTLPGRFARIPD